MANNKQIAKNLFFNIASFAINLCISFLFTPYLIKVVGKEAYGFFPLVNNFIGYTGIITTAVGSMAGRFITMHIYKNDTEGANYYFNSVFVANIILSAIFSIAAFFMVFYIDKILTVPDYLLTDIQWLFAFASLSMILGLATGILGVGSFVKNRLDLLSSRTVITNLTRVCLILLLFFIFRPSIIYMSLSAFGAALLSVYYNFLFKRKLMPELSIQPRRYYSWPKLKEMISAGVWNSVNQLSILLLTQLDLLITNIFIGVVATADYSIAKMAPMLILQFLGVVSGSFYPNFNILYAQGKIKELVSDISKSMIIIGLMIGIPIGILLVFAGDFYKLWIPTAYNEDIYWLSFISLLPLIFNGCVNPIFGVFSTVNKLKIPSITVLVAGILNTTVIFILLKTTNLGIWSIPITSAIQSGLRNFLFTPIYGAICLQRKWYSFFKTQFKGVASMIVVVLISLAVRTTITPNSWSLFMMDVTIVSFIALFANSFIILNKNERKLLFSKIKKRIKKN